MTAATLRVEIRRADPSRGAAERYERFEVPAAPGMRVLDVLRAVHERGLTDLAFQYACRIGRCGTCGVRVNGVPVLACQERAKPRMRVDPLPGMPVIRDLVVDRSAAEARFAALDLAPAGAGAEARESERDGRSAPADVGVLGTCISCLVCVSACPAAAERPFDGPAYMVQLRRLAEHPADARDRLGQAVRHGMLECFGCDACTQLCPVSLSPAEVIRRFRRDLATHPARPLRGAGT